MKDIFKGNSHFAIIGNVHGMREHLPHTLNTLNFVSLAKSVRTNPQINFEAKEAGQKVVHAHVGRFLQLPAFSNTEHISTNLAKAVAEIKQDNARVIERLQDILSGQAQGSDVKSQNGLYQSILGIYNDLTLFLNNFLEFTPVQCQVFEGQLLSFRARLASFFGPGPETLIKKINDMLDKLRDHLGTKKAKVKLYSIQNLKPDHSEGRDSSFGGNDQRSGQRRKGFNNIVSRYRKSESLSALKMTVTSSPYPKQQPGTPLPQKSPLVSFVNKMSQSQSRFCDTEFDRDISVFLRENFEKDRYRLDEERRRFEQERQTLLENRDCEISDLKQKLKRLSDSLQTLGLLPDQPSDGSLEDGLISIHLKRLSEGNFSKQGKTMEARRGENDSPNSDIQKLRTQIESLQKRISNLERQLRNRNKDYLFALKELEKVKGLATPPVKTDPFS